MRLCKHSLNGLVASGNLCAQGLILHGQDFDGPCLIGLLASRNLSTLSSVPHVHKGAEGTNTEEDDVSQNELPNSASYVDKAGEDIPCEGEYSADKVESSHDDAVHDGVGGAEDGFDEFHDRHDEVVDRRSDGHVCDSGD